MSKTLGFRGVALGAFLIGGALAAACSDDATASSDDTSTTTDAGTDASVRSGNDAGGSTSSDSGTKTDSSTTTDSGTTTDASATDAATDAAVEAGACGDIGKTCDPDDTFSCPLFWDCVPAWQAPIVGVDAGDASADASGDAAADAGADADAGAPAYVCLPLNLATADCNNGVDTCATGSCLLAAGRCLSPQETTCVCPSHAGACSP
ncbi:MAG: hypothetical protein U0235_02645 [Polyangiaceae bacterium]